MAIKIHAFDTDADFQAAYNGSAYTEPWVSYTRSNEEVNYNKIPDPLAVPFTIEMLQNGSINLYGTYSYSLNGGEWIDVQDTSLEMNLSMGDKISFKGLYGLSLGDGTVTGNFKVYGNIMSLRCGDNFASALDIPANTTFANCFDSNGYLISASDLLLPATGLTEECYSCMFSACGNMTHGPAILPATTLANNCYYWMFFFCTSLTSAPELPATSVSNFTQAYQSMFYDCNNLSYIKAMFLDEPSSSGMRYGATEAWTEGVSATGTFVMNSNASWDPANNRGAWGIPSGWTVQTA